MNVPHTLGLHPINPSYQCEFRLLPICIIHKFCYELISKPRIATPLYDLITSTNRAFMTQHICRNRLSQSRPILRDPRRTPPLPPPPPPLPPIKQNHPNNLASASNIPPHPLSPHPIHSQTQPHNSHLKPSTTLKTIHISHPPLPSCLILPPLIDTLSNPPNLKHPSNFPSIIHTSALNYTGLSFTNGSAHSQAFQKKCRLVFFKRASKRPPRLVIPIPQSLIPIPRLLTSSPRPSAQLGCPVKSNDPVCHTCLLKHDSKRLQ